MGRSARSPPIILVPYASRRPLGEIAGYPFAPAGPSARTLSEPVWSSLRNTSPSRTERVGERSEVARRASSRESRARVISAADHARCHSAHPRPQPQIRVRAAAEERQAPGGSRGATPCRRRSLAAPAHPLAGTSNHESLSVQIYALSPSRGDTKVLYPRQLMAGNIPPAELLDHSGVGRGTAVYRHDPPIRLERRTRTGIDEHRSAVRQPRRARHIDQFQRDRSKTAAAGSDTNTGGVLRDTREAVTIGGNPAAAAPAAGAAVTAKRRNS
jgi:hypothetical protein